MTRKKRKERQRRYISKDMDLEHSEEEIKKKGKRHMKKPKMPARIKSTPRERHK